jgi:hypothetical protein
MSAMPDDTGKKQRAPSQAYFAGPAGCSASSTK